MKFAKRATILKESATIAVSSLAKKLRAEGKDVIDFSAGEPDFDTPTEIKDGAKAALDAGYTKYTAVPGAPELLKAVADKLERENGLKYAPNDIVVSNGAKQSLFNMCAALVEEGDEVIIPAPYWVTYPELVRYFGGTVIEPKTDESTNFKLTAAKLKSLINEKTKLFILTSPSNPTGSVYTKAELEEIAEVLKGTNVWVASDEMYEKLLYDGAKFTATASISDDMFNRTITINGLSKSVAMTGWRMGYAASPNKQLVKAMADLQSQSTSNINSITQKASLVALSGSVDTKIEEMRKVFEERRNLACELINKIDGLSVFKPNGAFYLYVNCSKVQPDSMKFAKELLETEGVAVVPGVGFGVDGYFRISFAMATETIEKGIARIAKFVASCK